MMKCLVQLFREQVAAHPSSIALDDSTLPGVSKHLTYQELDELSETFSHELRQRGVGPKDIVPILSTRCIGSIAAILAVQKLRACYVPIDTDSWGNDRIENTISRVKPKLVIATNPDGYFGQGTHQVVHIAPDGSFSASPATPPDSPRAEDPYESIPDDWSYLIFTSGSTGKPKGVVVNQRSITTLVTERNELPFNLNTNLDSRVLLIFSFAFDACTYVIFSTLCNGATLVLSSPTTLADVAETCSIWIVTPSILTAMDPSRGYAKATTIIMGGESPTPFLVDNWTAPGRQLINVYGPTEATCVVTMAEMRPGEPIVMGAPVPYADVILVDEHDNEADEGEMLVGGAGVAVGYYADAELTARAFVRRPDGRLFYRTKDYARRTPEGAYAFCGRKDGVVKNRGFLINLESEVEPAMLACGGDGEAKGAAAVSHRGTLVGFVTPAAAADGLRDRMLAEYSAFLVPDVVHGLDSFPSTGNGKVDRKALAAFHERTQESQLASVEEYLKRSGESGREIAPLEAVRVAVCVVLRIPEARVEEDASFRALGGHSLAAVMLVSTLRKLGYDTDVVSIFSQDTVKDIAASVRKIEAEHNSVCFDEERRRFAEEIGLAPETAEVAPATDMQIRMVRGTIDNPSLNFIKIGMTFDNRGDPAFLATLREAWKRLVQRHSMLRTSFRLSSSEPTQLLQKEVESFWQEHLISEEAWASAENDSQQFKEDDFDSFDDQDNSDLSRLRLLVLPDLRVRLVWTVHHSLIDGWSASVILNDLWEILHNRDLPPCPQFTDAAWELRRLTQQNSPAAKAFWKDKLGEIQSIPRLRIPPTEDASSKSLSEKHRKISVRVSELETAAKKTGVTSATLVYGAWALLLSRYCDSQTVVLGTVLSGRSLPLEGVEKIVGPLVNSLPMPVGIDVNKPVPEYLEQVFKSLCQLIDFQWTPNSLIQEATGSRGTDYFDTLLAIQYDFPAPQWPNARFSPPYDISISETTETPLTVMLDSVDGFLDARFVFRLSHFAEAMVERMINHFDNILRSLVDLSLLESREQGVNSVGDVARSMLSDEELHDRLNCTDHVDDRYEGPETLADAFETSLAQHSGYVAVEGLDRSLTYNEMNADTARIARVLLQHNVKAGEVVCVIADGSVDWLLAIMSVVRTGAAYCPIDHKLPAERQHYMMSVCSPPVVLYPNAQLRNQSAGHEGAVLLDVETLLSDEGSESDGSSSDGWEIVPKANATTDDIAVVIFTSGSTGFPKAVQLQHKAILSLLSHAPARLYSKPGQRNAQLLSLGFDCCVKEVFSSLLYGSALVLKDPADPLAHLSKVDAIVGTPSLISNLEPAEYVNLKIVTLVGEALPTPLARRWMPGRTLQNGYAPAECTLIATAHPLQPDAPISIGRPVPRVNFYILDSMGRPVPTGVSGEIYISGVQVTPGYRNNPEETKARFLPDPFREGWRVFRTGDIGRWLETGDIEYIGRNDNQVKVRGFRIDLGDVEASIARLAPSLDNVAVVVAGGTLRAFVTPETVDTEHLLRVLRSHLPEYSTPSNITAMKELPLSRNGKVDRGELAKLQLERGAALEALETDTERDVANAWAELLGRDQEQFPISGLDGFFDIGGHSLLQIRLAQKLSKLWHTRVPLKIIIRHQILRELCKALDEHFENESRKLADSGLGIKTSESSSNAFLAMEKTQRLPRMPASFLEQEFILNQQLSNESPVWNIVHACNAYGPLDLGALRLAFQNTVTKHEVLRSRYHVEDGQIMRSLADGFVPSHTECGEEGITDFISQKIQRPLDPMKEPLIQLHTATVTPWKTVIIVVMSHIIGDAPTLHTVLHEISAAYRRITSGAPPQATPSTPSTLTYLDWTQWAQPALPDKDTTAFWQAHLSDTRPTLPLGAHPQTYHGRTRTWTVRPALHKRLALLALDHGMTMHQIALATTFLALQSLAPTTTIALGAPMTLRTEPGTEHLPGLFLDRLVIPLAWDTSADDDGPASLPAFLATVRARSDAARAHFAPHRALRRALGGARAPGLADPLFQVMVSFHTAGEAGGKALALGDGVEVAPRGDARPACAKFPVMVEFTDGGEGGGLRVELECDGGVVGEGRAEVLEEGFVMAMEGLGRRWGVGEIVAAVRRAVVRGDGLPTPREEREIAEGLGGAEGKVVEGKAERVVAIREAMAECLGLERKDISCMRAFWDLGAESMDAVKLQAACERRGLKLGLRAIFESPTADALAELCTVEA
ncbi:nonribosomal peptide synthase 2 [Neofusicoccum parvum]|nr:nonribosomal peptide synthase 2 [Neofusicoccum parvum]